MSSVKTVQITTKELAKDDSNNLNDILSSPSKISSTVTTNTSQTFTSKSNSKFVDFIWSKFTKPKNPSKEKESSNQNEDTSDKKRKRSIFNLFDSSKTKNSSGAKTNSNKCSKSNLEDKHVYDNNITSNTVDELTGSNLNSTLLSLEGKKPPLIDNSMVKSKIQAAKNSRKPRNAFTSKSSNSMSQSMEKIEEFPDLDTKDFVDRDKIKVIEESTSESNSNTDPIKSQLLSRKAFTASQELITSSTNFTSSSASSDIFEKTERLSKELNHRSSKNNLALNSATSFSNSNYKSITSIDNVGNRNVSKSPSTDSSDKNQAWITKEQINSTSSLITNLFENHEENFDLFGSNGFSSNSKSLIETSPKESPNTLASKQIDINNRNSDSDDSKKESLEYTKLSNKSSNKLEKISKKNLVIYDNNVLDQHVKSDEMKEDFKKLRQKFHTQLSVQLQTRRTEEFSKSKSCERIDKIDEPKTNGNDDIKKDFLLNINNNKDNKTIEIEQEISTEKEAIPSVTKRLSYSKSLKITQKNSPFIPKSDLNSSKVNTNETFSTRIMSGDNKFKETNRAPTKIPNEPTWKELAFKKQSAWNKKNLEQDINVSGINK